jgi:biotin carboxyl carrier protein
MGSYKATANGKIFDLLLENEDVMLVNGSQQDFHVIAFEGDVYKCKAGNKLSIIYLKKLSDVSYEAWINYHVFTVKVEDPAAQLLARFAQQAGASHDRVEITAPMPGLITSVRMQVGESVKKETAVATLEAMKMENELRSPIDGKITKVNVEKGARVEKSQLLMVIEACI